MASVILVHAAIFWFMEHGFSRRMVHLLAGGMQVKIILESRTEEFQLPPPPENISIPLPLLVPPRIDIQMPSESNTDELMLREMPKPAGLHAAASLLPTDEGMLHPRLDPKMRQRDVEDFYPAQAKLNKVEGTVTVAVYVGTRGEIISTEIQGSSNIQELDKSAVGYVKTLSLLPGSRNGVAAPMWFRVSVIFRASRPSTMRVI